MLKLEHPLSRVTLIAPQFEELTAANAAGFKRSILDLIEDGHSRIVIDLGQVNAVDSSGISALVGVLQRLGLRGEMALCGMSEKVERLFTLTRMDRVFPIHSDADGAVRALAA